MRISDWSSDVCSSDLLAIGMTRNHPGRIQIGPDGRKVFLPDAEQIKALPASDLHNARAIFVRCIGNGPQFIGRREPAPPAWHDRISAVILAIRVHPFINETAERVPLMAPRPGA